MGDVAHDSPETDDPVPGIFQQCEGLPERQPFAVLSDDLVVHIPAGDARQVGLMVPLIQHFSRLQVRVLPVVHAQQLFFRVAPHSLQGVVEKRKVAGQVRLVISFADALQDRPVFFLASAQRFLVLPVMIAHCFFFQSPLHGHAQPRQIALHDVVGRSAVDAVQRRFFADGAGNDDERNIEAGFLQQVYGFQTAESRHVVVAQNDVPRGAFQGPAHVPGRLRPLDPGLITVFFQRAGQKQRVVFRIFNQKHVQRFWHFESPRVK